MRCKKHLKYKAKRKPNSECKECWLIWEAHERARKVIREFFGITEDEDEKES